MIKLETKKQYIREVAAIIGSTITPSGRFVAFMLPNSTSFNSKDGVTILRHIKDDDKYKQLIVNLIRDGSESSVLSGGDGTSSTVILASKFYEALAGSITKPEFCKGFKECVEETQANVKLCPYKLEETEENLFNLAMTSSNNDEEISTLVQKAFSYTKGETRPTVNISRAVDGLVVQKGMALPCGYLTNSFCTDLRNQKADLDNPIVLATDNVTQADIVELQEAMKVAVDAKRPLVVFCNAMSDTGIKLMVTNHISGAIVCCIVELGYKGKRLYETVQDIKARTGCKNPLDHTMPEVSELGEAARILVGKEEVTIIPKEDTNEFLDYVEGLQQSVPEVESSWQKQRIDRLSSILVTVGVEAPTLVAKEERFLRLEDTVLSYDAALDSGMVPGMGFVYMSCRPIEKTGQSKCSKLYMEGWNKAYGCFNSIMDQCIKNIGIEGTSKEMLGDEVVYNAITGQFEGVRETSVVDCVQVVESVIKNAYQVGYTLANTLYLEVHENE